MDAWSETIPRVQTLAESGITTLPERYIKPPSERPNHHELRLINPDDHDGVKIPVIDLSGLDDDLRRTGTLNQISEACRDWGFFQAVNHGVSHELMDKTREVWREFFYLPLEEKEVYANTPKTYEGYGSRLGVEKGALLDWGDYFFLHYCPQHLRDTNKWPALPNELRGVMEEYSEALMVLCGRLLKAFSLGLGLREDFLMDAFGGTTTTTDPDHHHINNEQLQLVNAGSCIRINYYSKCPQPELTLGVSPHSDPGGLTILLSDDQAHVPAAAAAAAAGSLQVRNSEAADKWVTVKPQPYAFVVNIADQIQVLSNAVFKSVEHRVKVNSDTDRVSIAFFYNPKSDLSLEPATELVSVERPALYKPMTFDEYRLYIRTRGPQGKNQVDSLKSV